MKATRLLLTLSALLFSVAAHAEPIQWVTVGDPGNAADTDPTGYGAVATSFQIMKYEFTNQQYADFLNAAAKTDTYSLYNADMGTNAVGGITRSGQEGSYSYSVKQHMGDKPVNYVSWLDAARVANWYQNGATSLSNTETGAYTLNGAMLGGAAVNPGATFYVPTEDQWYKAAFYKGGNNNAGYWNFGTQRDTTPTTVTADLTGTGSAGLSSTANSANYLSRAAWGGDAYGNVTTVGTNGGPGAYDTFDMSGNLSEWVSGASGHPDDARLRGGAFWEYADYYVSSEYSQGRAASGEDISSGFRLASPVAVPEPSTYAMALAGIACGGYSMFRRRKRP
jgi:formylglycine-generating enzyme required for sulfatase activity